MEKIISYIREKQKEYQVGSAAHNALRDLEVTLPSLFPQEPLSSQGADIIKFLLGESDFNGVWFGDPKPDGERGNFWWRKHLREYAASQKQQYRSDLSPLIVESIHLLFVAQPTQCPDWKEGVGDCEKPECLFCRFQKCIDGLEKLRTHES